MVDGTAPTGDRRQGAYAESAAQSLGQQARIRRLARGCDPRQLRLAAAATRFKPAHTRVIMGAVAGMPSEDLAWHRFSNAAPCQLDWTLENEGR